MLKNIKAWKSTILGIALGLGVSIGVATGKLSEASLVALAPSIYLIVTNNLGIKPKKNEQE